MSTRLDTLDFLLNRALDSLNLAAKMMASAQRVLQQTQEKGQMLRGYQQDYRERLAQQLQIGLSKEAHHNYQHFLNKLEQAIVGQDALVLDAQYQFQIRQADWQQAQQKKMAYEVLMKQAKQKNQVAALKKDQKMMDEFAVRSRRMSAS